MTLHLRHRRTGQRVRVRRVKHYSLDDRQVALLRVILQHWRDLPVPLEGTLLELTDQLEEKFK